MKGMVGVYAASSRSVVKAVGDDILTSMGKTHFPGPSEFATGSSLALGRGPQSRDAGR